VLDSKVHHSLETEPSVHRVLQADLPFAFSEQPGYTKSTARAKAPDLLDIGPQRQLAGDDGNKHAELTWLPDAKAFAYTNQQLVEALHQPILEGLRHSP
jgi:hypothetical protein